MARRPFYDHGVPEALLHEVLPDGASRVHDVRQIGRGKGERVLVREQPSDSFMPGIARRFRSGLLVTIPIPASIADLDKRRFARGKPSVAMGDQLRGSATLRPRRR